MLVNSKYMGNKSNKKNSFSWEEASKEMLKFIKKKNIQKIDDNKMIENKSIKRSVTSITVEIFNFKPYVF